MNKILTRIEQPTCQKCIYANDKLLCHYDKATTTQKQQDEFCSDGRWMVKYRQYIPQRGRLVPKHRPKLYCVSMATITADRLRHEMMVNK